MVDFGCGIANVGFQIQINSPKPGVQRVGKRSPEFLPFPCPSAAEHDHHRNLHDECEWRIKKRREKVHVDQRIDSHPNRETGTDNRDALSHKQCKVSECEVALSCWC